MSLLGRDDTSCKDSPDSIVHELEAIEDVESVRSCRNSDNWVKYESESTVLRMTIGLGSFMIVVVFFCIASRRRDRDRKYIIAMKPNTTTGMRPIHLIQLVVSGIVSWVSIATFGDDTSWALKGFAPSRTICLTEAVGGEGTGSTTGGVGNTRAGTGWTTRTAVIFTSGVRGGDVSTNGLSFDLGGDGVALNGRCIDLITDGECVTTIGLGVGLGADVTETIRREHFFSRKRHRSFTDAWQRTLLKYHWRHCPQSCFVRSQWLKNLSTQEDVSQIDWADA